MKTGPILTHINIKVCSGTFLVVTDYSLSFTDKKDQDKEGKDMKVKDKEKENKVTEIRIRKIG